ncbi:DUF3492 domain-containing protein [Streptomyces sp. MUM 178J]|uniref:DUF3492 domain-containing protein n=1 Tax=Streptomyces sp. MUM 178J TaxID=2791991 RepID=UPI001F03D9C6|nr:DUF3492 domain-containing protein [Streptomyces sp. MUM 178J]WRQ81417.1 DUF3492 domain-containing protein [Streptomyces sp. MUM 178J]
MRIGLLTESGYPYATGESRLWCDRLVRGLDQHDFDVYALSGSARQEAGGWVSLPPQVGRVRTAPLWTPDFRPGGDGRGQGARERAYGRRERRRFLECFEPLAAAVCTEEAGGTTAAGRPGGDHEDGRDGADSGDGGFADGLYALAGLARERGGLPAALRSEHTVRVLESACRAPGARRAVRSAGVADYLLFADQLERALRPLSLDWYDDEEDGLGAVDLCHAASGGSAALPGLVAKRFFGVPLLVTEYGVQLRAHYLASGGALSAPVRALLAGFHRRLAAEIYRRASVITPGNTHARRWQEKCGADRAKLRTVYPGMEADRFAAVGESEPERGSGPCGGGRARAYGGYSGHAGHGCWDDGVSGADDGVSGGDDGVSGGGAAAEAEAQTLVWVGRIEPAKDLIALLHAFAEIRREEPRTRLRIFAAPGQGRHSGPYLDHCQALAAQLFPDEAADAHAVGDNPVSFEEIGGPEAPELADAYASGGITVLSSVVEGFPISLIEAMFCARATVSTDVGAVVEVIGGTGLVVPPRNPRALADACLALLRDPERSRRLGAAARARAMELFTVEQNVAAFREIYLELISHSPVRRDVVDEDGEPLPFANPVEVHVPGGWPSSHADAHGPSRPRPARTAHASEPTGPAAHIGAHALAYPLVDSALPPADSPAKEACP